MIEKFKIKIDGSDIVIESKENHQNLLEVLESSGFFVDYNCRQGFCGACKIKIVNGAVHYINKPLAFIPEGIILPCCCLPSEDIEITINEKTDN